MFNDFINLIFPELCAACNHALLKNEVVICTSCELSLPKSNACFDQNNPLLRSFFGRVDIKMAAAYYQFNKQSKVQHLLHQLKYKNYQEVGDKIGQLFGHELNSSIYFKGIELIIPVPLNDKKLKQRGYNQSELFAKGLSSSMGIPVSTSCLYRNIHSKTQTNRSRYNRWENVKDAFEVKNIEEVRGKSILLVDDVITTGATIEACASLLKELHCTVYVAAIASV